MAVWNWEKEEAEKLFLSQETVDSDIIGRKVELGKVPLLRVEKLQFVYLSLNLYLSG